MPESGLARLFCRWRVRVSFVFLILALIFAQPTLISLLAGIGLTGLGLCIRAWACGHLEKEKNLTVTGPYRYTRNPLYFANLIIGVSVVVAAQSWWVLGFGFVFFFVFYLVVIYAEKQKMERLFPEKYADCKEKVPLFLPTFRPPLSQKPQRFRWSLYHKNREFRAFLGAVAFWLVMAAKMIL